MLPGNFAEEVGQYVGLDERDKRLITAAGDPLGREEAEGIVQQKWTVKGWVFVAPAEPPCRPL